jgi:hypothetical protein
MSLTKSLIEENTRLKAHLSLAQKWMKREVQSAMQSLKEKSLRKNTRKHFENMMQQESMTYITHHIQEIFGTTLQNSPSYTLERLIDSEIYY